MELFTVIDDAQGILRLPKGVQKQVKLYKRNDRIYAPHGGGYIEIRGLEHDGTYNTSHPDIKLLEFECSNTHHRQELGQQRLRYGKKGH